MPPAPQGVLSEQPIVTIMHVVRICSLLLFPEDTVNAFHLEVFADSDVGQCLLHLQPVLGLVSVDVSLRR